MHESEVGGMKKHLILGHNEPWSSIVIWSLQLCEQITQPTVVDFFGRKYLWIIYPCNLQIVVLLFCTFVLVAQLWESFRCHLSNTIYIYIYIFYNLQCQSFQKSKSSLQEMCTATSKLLLLKQEYFEEDSEMQVGKQHICKLSNRNYPSFKYILFCEQSTSLITH